MSDELPEGFTLDDAPPAGFTVDTPEAAADTDDAGFLQTVKESATDFLRGAGEGALFGFGGEARGAVDSIGAGLSGAPRAVGRGTLPGVDPMTTQQRAQAGAAEGEREYEGALAQSRARSPTLTTAGDIAGSIGSAAIPGGMLAKAAGKVAPAAANVVRTSAPLMRVAQLAEAGASGAVAAQGRGLDPVAGGGIGLLAGAGGQAAVGAAQSVMARRAAGAAERLTAKAVRYKDMSDEKLLQAAGFERAAITKVNNQPGGVKRLADGIRQQGLAADKTLPEARDFLEGAQKLREKAVAGMGAASSQLDDVGAIVNAENVATRIEKEIVDEARRAGSETRARLWQRKADEVRSTGRLSFKDAHARRMEFDANAGFQMAAKPERGAFKAARNILNEEMDLAAKRHDDLSEAFGGDSGALGELWRQSNKQFGIATEVIKAAEKSVRAKAGNLPFGLGDMISSSAGAGIGASALGPGGVLAGIPTAMALRQVQKRGSGVLSNVYGGMSERASEAAARASAAPAGQMVNGGHRIGSAAAARLASPAPRPPEKHEPKRDRLREIITPTKKSDTTGDVAALDNQIREALNEDPVNGAATYFTTSVTNPEYREKRPYNAK